MRAREWRQGVLVVVMLVTSVWLGTLITGLFGKARIAVTQARAIEKQYQELKARKDVLQANVSALKTARGQDAAVRTAFGVAKPGEEVIVVVPPAASTTTPPTPWWKKLTNWF